MKTPLAIRIAGAAALTLALCVGSVQAGRATPPKLAAKRAEAARVLSEIASIDESLNTVSEQYDGARVRLQALRKNLRTEQAQLAQARARYHRAELRAAKLAVWIYTSNHSSSIDVILGATTLTQMLQISDTENAISGQAVAIAAQTAQARRLLQARVHVLAVDRAAAASTVKELGQRRTEILRGLAQRRKLLASVQAEVTRLEAAERARQERLAAEARARLAAEAKARAAAAAKARAQLAAQQAAKAKAASEAAARAAAAATTTATTTTTTATTAATATSTTVAATTTTSTTVDPEAATPPASQQGPPDPNLVTVPTTTIPTALLPAGHPYAATIALQYLGIPYQWGGASPATGFDCSGLVTYVFAQLGIDLPHFAADQWSFGVPVAVSQLQPGDLVFFDALDHVGIYLGNGEFINAPHTGSFVRIDTLSEPWYAKHYVGARRI
jgi:peptidoglycan DL-endopeptidase CwlO